MSARNQGLYIFCIQVPVVARMWSRVFLLVLVTVLMIDGEDIQEAYDSQLQVGRSIDIFPRYGYLSISMKVVPQNMTDFDTIFREPTVDVFANIEPYIIRGRRLKKSVFDGEFHMEFCDNIRQLLQAYFREFDFEKLDKPWRAFTSSWSKELIAKHMGINSSFVLTEQCYVLVRLSRFRENVTLSRLPNNVNLTEMVAQEIANIKLGNYESVLTFIKKFGSHYIRSYVTGNSLYQVIPILNNTTIIHNNGIIQGCSIFKIKNRFRNKNFIQGFK